MGGQDVVEPLLAIHEDPLHSAVLKLKWCDAPSNQKSAAAGKAQAAGSSRAF